MDCHIPCFAGETRFTPRPLIKRKPFSRSSMRQVQFESSGVEILAKHRAKLMSLSPDKKWKDKGAGTLTLRRPVGGGSAFLVFTTDSGRVLIRAPLIKGMKPTTNPKTPANLIMFLISKVDDDAPEEQGMHLFKCESGDRVKELQKEIGDLV